MGRVHVDTAREEKRVRGRLAGLRSEREEELVLWQHQQRVRRGADQ